MSPRRRIYIEKLALWNLKPIIRRSFSFGGEGRKLGTRDLQYLIEASYVRILALLARFPFQAEDTLSFEIAACNNEYGVERNSRLK